MGPHKRKEEEIADVVERKRKDVHDSLNKRGVETLNSKRGAPELGSKRQT